jgi:hypothetical protein
MIPTSALSASALVAYLPEFPTLRESLGFQANGLIVVLIALCSIWGVLELIGLYFKRVERQAGLVAETTGPAAPQPAEVGLSPEIIAVIASAVHATLGPRHRIHAVTTVEPPVDWAREGRRQIFASHKVR